MDGGRREKEGKQMNVLKRGRNEREEEEII